MSQQGGGGGGKGMENFALGALGVALLFGFVLIGAGSLSAVLVGNEAPTLSLGDAPGVITGLATNPGEPSKAFPVEEQASIPGPFVFYLSVLFIIVVLAGIVYAGYTLVKRGSSGGSKGGLGQKGTQWARRNDMKSLVVPKATPGRLVLGHVGNAMIATEQRHSVIVLGPTQSGKTTGLAVPSILEWRGPVIATSVKNDLAEHTLEWRKRQGEVWIYDPTQATGLPTNTWSPLDGAREWSGAQKIASWLADASKGDTKSLQDGDFWNRQAKRLLAPHLFAAAANGYTMADVVRWIVRQEEFEVRSLLQATGVEEAMDDAESLWSKEERTRSSIYTTAEGVIDAYADPTVRESARTSEIKANRFLDGGNHTLYICAPSHEQDRLRPVFTTIIKQIITAAYDSAPLRPAKRLDPSLLIVLDEAANIAPLDNLDSIASTCSGLGIQLMTVWQDLAQINARYGDRAQTVVNNHRAKIVLSGISDTSTLDYVSRLIGSEEVKSTSTSIDAQGSKSTTTQNSDKNLAPSDVVRRIKMNEGVLIYGALLPARLRLRPWYKNKRLTAMVNNTIPSTMSATRNVAGDDDDESFRDFQRTSPVG